MHIVLIFEVSKGFDMVKSRLQPLRPQCELSHENSIILIFSWAYAINDVFIQVSVVDTGRDPVFFTLTFVMSSAPTC